MMNLPENNNSASEPQSLIQNPEILAVMLKNQESEIRVRSEDIKFKDKELGLREREIDKAHEFAMKSLDVQASDRVDERKFQRSLTTKIFLFLGIALSMIVLGFCYAIHLGKDAIVMEIVKAMIYLGAGGLGGYSAKSTKDKKKNDDESWAEEDED